MPGRRDQVVEQQSGGKSLARWLTSAGPDPHQWCWQGRAVRADQRGVSTGFGFHPMIRDAIPPCSVLLCFCVWGWQPRGSGWPGWQSDWLDPWCQVFARSGLSAPTASLLFNLKGLMPSATLPLLEQITSPGNPPRVLHGNLALCKCQPAMLGRSVLFLPENGLEAAPPSPHYFAFLS